MRATILPLLLVLTIACSSNTTEDAEQPIQPQPAYDYSNLVGPSAEVIPLLPAPYATSSVARTGAYEPWNGRKPTAPAGFVVNVYAEGLSRPRWLLPLPNGDVLVAESYQGRIRLLRDTDGDGDADERPILLDGQNRPFGMAYHDGQLYVANTDAVLRFPYTLGQTSISASGTKLLDLPAGGYNNHWTRNLLLTPDATGLYVSTGSASNAAAPGENGESVQEDLNHPYRCTVMRMNLDGSNVQVLAKGLRNPMGLAVRTGTNELYTVVNERDGLGDDLVPDYLTRVRPNQDYGFPHYYFGTLQDPRHTTRPSKMPDIPTYALGAHTASLSVAFPPACWPAQWQGAFIGQHGSWNRSKPAGYRVLFVPFNADGQPYGNGQDFLTGFLVDSAAFRVTGRPTDVKFAADGALLLTDDQQGVIWRVKPQ